MLAVSITCYCFILLEGSSGILFDVGGDSRCISSGFLCYLGFRVSVGLVGGRGWELVSGKIKDRRALPPPSTPNEQAAPREHPAPRTAGRRAAASSPALPPAHRSTCIIKSYILTFICRQKIENHSKNRHPQKALAQSALTCDSSSHKYMHSAPSPPQLPPR